MGRKDSNQTKKILHLPGSFHYHNIGKNSKVMAFQAHLPNQFYGTILFLVPLHIYLQRENYMQNSNRPLVGPWKCIAKASIRKRSVSESSIGPLDCGATGPVSQFILPPGASQPGYLAPPPRPTPHPVRNVSGSGSL